MRGAKTRGEQTACSRQESAMPCAAKEDERLISGRGSYADDLAYRRRSTRRVRALAACACPYPSRSTSKPRASILASSPSSPAPMLRAPVLSRSRMPSASSHKDSDVPLRNRDGSERLATEQLLLPMDRARFAGEAIAWSSRRRWLPPGMRPSLLTSHGSPCRR